jgi:hypothetical protein
LSNDLIFNVFPFTHIILDKLERLELPKVLQLLNIDCLLYHIFQPGHFLEAEDNIHELISEIIKLFLESKPFLIETVNFPQIISGQDIGKYLSPVVVDEHNLNFLFMQGFQNVSDLLFDLTLFTIGKFVLGVDPLYFGVAVL